MSREAWRAGCMKEQVVDNVDDEQHASDCDSRDFARSHDGRQGGPVECVIFLLGFGLLQAGTFPSRERCANSTAVSQLSSRGLLGGYPFHG